jgi:ketosteroid isomerase-like protein
MLGKADDLLICPVRSRWSVKSLGITYIRVVANTLHDDVVWVYPGDKHPMSGTHKGKEAFMKNMMQVPNLFSNFHVLPESMISEGDKVFVNVKATADGMDTIFGHYFEVKDGKLSKFIAYDDTLSMFNAVKK